MHINELPPELLVLIFSKIDDFSQKIRLELVCRHWRQNVFLNWKTAKTCPNPLDNQETFRHVLNRCGEWLEELWLQYAKFTEKSINRIKRMKCLKHLKLSKCQLDDASVDSIADLFGQQLCSFILDETPYHTKMRRMIENNSSKLEHLQIYLNRNYSARTLPSKFPANLKSFALHTSSNEIRSLLLIRRVAKNCKNLKILHLEMHTLWPDIIWAIGNIKSLIYLNLDVNFIANAFVLKNVICNELPNLKAIKIAGYCYEETVLDICQVRPDLLYFNVYTDITQQDFQISESLNSLAIHSKTTDENFRLLLLKILLFQKNKSVQHLDIRSFILPSPNYLIKLLGLFPDLKSIHCKLTSIFTDLTIFFYIIEKNLENGRNFTIYFHFNNQQNCKYSLPDDFRQFNNGWRANISKGKCENLVLRKMIKEAIEGANNPSFLDDLWME